MDGRATDHALAALVDRLRGDLGPDYFVEVRHWEDLAATGLGRPDDPRFLVYLDARDPQHVYVECEIPPADENADFPYDLAGSGTYSDYRQILGIVRDHLARLLSPLTVRARAG
jgi:hypothetical protein